MILMRTVSMQNWERDCIKFKGLTMGDEVETDQCTLFFRSFTVKER